MPVLRRITPDEGAEIFARAHLEPTPVVYLSHHAIEPCGCLLGALAIEALGVDEARALIDDSLDRPGPVGVHVGPRIGLDPDYAQGLDVGFSGGGLPADREEFGLETEAYWLGVEDGNAVAGRVL